MVTYMICGVHNVGISECLFTHIALLVYCLFAFFKFVFIEGDGGYMNYITRVCLCV